MLVIYTPHISPRLQYIVAHLFEGSARITTSLEDYQHDENIKINYAETAILENELWIQPLGLLAEHDIHEWQIDLQHWNQLPIFFVTNGSLPFDIFSASFYLLSRYEEYLPHEKDRSKKIRR